MDGPPASVERTASALPSSPTRTSSGRPPRPGRRCVLACDQVVDEAGRVVGPGGLSGDARLARTLADLTIYVRQHHLDGTLESLGRHALEHRTVSG